MGDMIGCKWVDMQGKMCIYTKVYKRKMERSKLLSILVPRPGIEPGWIAPLVFETSASTDSAIWANTTLLICGCKGTNNF